MVDTKPKRLEKASSGALRVALSHLQKARERTEKAQERLGATEDIDFQWDNTVGWDLGEAKGSLDNQINRIECELRSRDEPFEK